MKIKSSLLFFLILFSLLFSEFSYSQVDICGTTAFWSRVTTYNNGDQVQLNGVLYKAKWYTRDETPDLNSGGDSTPWEIIGNCDGSVDTISCQGSEVWLNTIEYQAGNQIIRNNSLYQGNFYSLNKDPEINSFGSGAPWTFVGACNSTTESTCDLSTPTFEFDLGGSPDSLWVSPQVRRDGLCCSVDPSERPPARCVEFFFTLDDDAIGIIFDIMSGAVPPGALYYQINCQGRYQFGELLCLSGPGPYRLTFCKPGNNPNTYGIQSVGKPDVSPPVTVSDGCTADLFAYGYDWSTVTWSSVPSNPVWESYLSCTSICDSVHVQYAEGAPDSVVYQVSGFPPGGCLPDPVVNFTTVYFVNDKLVEIQPKDAMVCFGENTATLTAFPSGGKPPHRFLWSTGDTTQIIDVGPGSYSVEVFDNTTCPSASDDVTVGAFILPIVADAGEDQNLCATKTQVQLHGQIFEALGGKWMGGNGRFIPNDSTLDAIYEPTFNEIQNGITLTLISTGNKTCPGDSDDVLFTFFKVPTLTIPDSLFACSNNPNVSISASTTNSTRVLWKGAGQIAPNDSSINIAYTPSSLELGAQEAIVSITAFGSNNCPDISDSLVITYYPLPILVAGNDIITCRNNPVLQLSASVQNAAGVEWEISNGQYSPSRTSYTPTYIPSANELLRDSIYLYISAIDDHNCQNAIDSQKVVFSPAPIINVYNDTTICDLAESISLNAKITNASGVNWSGGNGVFTNANGLSTTYILSDLDKVNDFFYLYTTTINENNCLNVVDSVRIEFDRPPSLTLNDSSYVCANNIEFEIRGDGSNLINIDWTSNGGGNFVRFNSFTSLYKGIGTDTLLTPLYVFAHGNSANSCPDIIDSSIIFFLDEPQIDISNLARSCENNPDIQLFAKLNDDFNVRWLGGEGVFSPNRTTLSPIYTPSANEINNGSLQLQVISTNVGNCLPVTETIDISIIKAPSINVGNDIEICSDQNSVVLTAETQNSNSIKWTGSDGIILPNDSSLQIEYLFSDKDRSDSVIVFLAETRNNSPCLESNDVITITLFQAPFVEAGANISLCTSQDSTLLFALGTDSLTGRWTSSGSGRFSDSLQFFSIYKPSTNDRLVGDIYLKFQSDSFKGCELYQDSLILSFENGPVIDLSPDVELCKGNYPVQIIANGSPGKWTGRGGIFQKDSLVQANAYSPSQSEENADSTFLIYITEASVLCPSIQDTLYINFKEGPNLSPLSNDTICNNISNYDLSVTVSDNYGVFWSTSGQGIFSSNNLSSNPSYNPTVLERQSQDTLPIQFTVRSTGVSLCPHVSKKFTLYLIPEKQIEAGNNHTICFSTGMIDLNAKSNNVNSFVWETDGQGNFGSADSSSIIYTIHPSDTLQDSVLFKVTSQDLEYCPEVQDSVYLTILSSPYVRANIPNPVCKDVSIISLAGIAESAVEYYWETNGGGNISSTTTLQTTYSKIDSDTALDPLYFILKARGTGGCEIVQDSVLVSFNEPVSIEYVGDKAICKDQDSVLLKSVIRNAENTEWTTSNGRGKFSNLIGDSVYYRIAKEDLGLNSLLFESTSLENKDCFEQTIEVNIQLLEKPEIQIPDFSVCKDANDIELRGRVANAKGLVFKTFGKGDLQIIDSFTVNYSISSIDTLQDSILFYVESIGNDACKIVEDSFSLFFDPIPQINLGDDDVLCLDETNIQIIGDIKNAKSILWTTNGNGFFSNKNGLQTSYFINDLDKKMTELIITGSTNGREDCKVYTDQIKFTFTKPVEIVSEELISCESAGGAFELTPKVTNAQSYKWTTEGSGNFTSSDSVLNVSYNPSGQDRTLDSIIIQLKAVSCIEDSAKFILRFSPGPQVVAPKNIELCESIRSVLQASTSHTDNVVWSTNGSGIIELINDSTIQYLPTVADIALGKIQFQLQGSKIGCPAVTDSSQIQILSFPEITSQGSLIVCRSTQSEFITSSITDFNGKIKWSSSGSGNFSDDDSIKTQYFFSAADANLDTITLYLKTEQKSCLPSITDSVQLIYTNYPIVDAGEDQKACFADAGVKFSGYVEGATGVKWSTNGSGRFSSLTFSNPTYFFSEEDKEKDSILLFMESRGASICANKIDTVVFYLLDNPIVEIGEDKVFCDVIPSIELKGLVQNASSFEWFSTGVGNFKNGTNSTDNQYQATVIDTTIRKIKLTLLAYLGGCSANDDLDVIFEPAPSINLENTSACQGDTISILGKPSGFISSGAKYQWEKNDTLLNVNDSILHVTKEGLYSILMEIDQCKAEKDAFITFNPRPEISPKKTYYLCEEISSTVDVSAEGNNLKFYWVELRDSSKIVNIDKSGEYTYLSINEFDCFVSNPIQIDDVCPPRIFTPSIFTPNDGQNYEMTIAGKYIRNYDLTIFNRWGEIIFHTEDINDFWDGNYRNEPMPEGVYNWIIYYSGDERLESEKKMIKGIITLVR